MQINAAAAPPVSPRPALLRRLLSNCVASLLQRRCNSSSAAAAPGTPAQLDVAECMSPVSSSATGSGAAAAGATAIEIRQWWDSTFERMRAENPGRPSTMMPPSSMPAEWSDSEEDDDDA